MLMHHTDIQFRGVVGGRDLYLFSPDIDFPFIRLVHTEKHTHQR